MYKVFMSQETKDETITLELPVLPEEIEVKQDIDNIAYNILQIGNVIKPGDRKLKSFEIKSYFPIKNSEISIRIIEKMIENKLPLRFVMNRCENNELLFDMNIIVVIDSFSYKEKGGEIGEVYYALKFTEYKYFNAKVIDCV